MKTLPPRISIELTFGCNHRCLFCSCPWLRHAGLAGRELERDEWMSVLDKLAANSVKHVTFSGGEPLMKADFVEILTYAAQLPFESVSVFSNGLLIDLDMLNIFQKHKIQWATSLPGVFAFRRLTASAMSARQLLEKIKLAAGKKVPVSVSITVVRQNLWEVVLTALLAKFYGASSLMIGPCMPEGRALEHPELLLQDTQYDRLLKTARMLKTMLKLPLYFSYEKRCECYELDGTPTGTVPESCTAGKDFAVISPDGTLRKCMHSPEKICSFDEFLHKEKV